MRQNVSLASLASILLLVATFTSCETERDRLVFVDSPDYVQKNVIAMDSLLKLGCGKCGKRYYVIFKPDTVEVHNPDVDGPADAEYFCDSAKVPLDDLKKISNVLSRNGINGVYRQYGTDISIFKYRELETHEFASVRDIFIDDSTTKKTILSGHSPMDRKGKLMLMHPVDF